MNAQVNTLDMLLGLTGGQQNPKGFDMKSVEQSATSFIDILGLLTAQNVGSQAELAGQHESNLPFAELLNVDPASSYPQDRVNSLTPEVSAKLHELVTESEANRVLSDIDLLQLAEALSAPTINSSADSTSRIENARNFLPVSQSLRIPQQDELPLQNTEYAILSQTVTDSKIEFQLASGKDSSEKISISLPNASLADAIVKQDDTNGPHARVRVPISVLTSQSSADQQLNKMLQDLKLQTLKVELAPIEESGSDEAVKIDLTGVKGSEPVVISQQVPRPLVKLVKTSDRQPLLTRNSTESPAKQLTAEKGIETARAIQQAEHEAKQPVTIHRRNPLFDLPDKLNSNLNVRATADTKPLDSFSFVESANNHRSEMPKVEYSDIRVKLPHDFSPQLASSSKSIMLKIEPEHLGPARLNLAMRHYGLVARVTVETTQAKMVVEHSLNQLHEQLNKAGITVDKIEVHVGNESHEQQLFHRHPDWQRRPQRMTQITDLDDFADGIERPMSVAATTSTVNTGYITNQGINILA